MAYDELYSTSYTLPLLTFLKWKMGINAPN